MKTAYAGAGLALTAGLLMGAAMKPDLAGDDRPAGPQIFAGLSGTRATGPFDDGLTVARYSGKIPDYVLGSDWQKMAQPPTAAPPPRGGEDDAPETYAQSYYESPLRDEPPEPQVKTGDLTSAAYAEAAAERVSFPSIDGGAAYAGASRAEDIETEAPPEATGDTRPAR
ncbi:MAG: hypothetical protein JWQ97_1023 [Phenylobacterium sp.]|nr:hypothetical protein [Phenylobacterium sp.]